MPPVGTGSSSHIPAYSALAAGLDLVSCLADERNAIQPASARVLLHPRRTPGRLRRFERVSPGLPQPLQPPNAIMDGPLHRALVGLHYLYPAIVFTYFIIASGVSVCTLQTLKASIQPKNQRVPRQSVRNVLLLIVLTYLAQLTATVIRSIVTKSWLGREDVVVGWLSWFMVYGVQSASLAQTEHPVWYPFYGTWLLALACEITLAVLYFSRNGKPLSGLPSMAHFGLCTLRSSLLLLLAVTYFSRRDGTTRAQSSDEECQSLLDSNGSAQQPELNGNGSTTAQQNQGQGYGSTQGSDAATKKRPNELPYERRQREGREKLEKRLQEEGNWFTYVRKFLVSPPRGKISPYRVAVQVLTISCLC